MQLPMVGTLTVEVLGARAFTIHGDLYYEIHVENPEAPDQVIGIRVPQHAIEGAPAAGEKLVLTFLMGQVTEAKRQNPP